MNQIIETKKEIKETTPTAEYFFPEPVDGYCFSHCCECHAKLTDKERKTGYDVCRDCIVTEVSLHKNEKVVYHNV